ncbi:hypothetical protein RRG08_040652 [Elysia crispata]|uniref:Uncharacterized protein n=1 Tax=Elysia crispata TaxID=231223 RepID=A0AAE0YXI6_9GAST|nr:hypothetical protein RRG08_040652 [Elysia crispata]
MSSFTFENGSGNGVMPEENRKVRPIAPAQKQKTSKTWREALFDFTQNTTLHGIRFVFMDNVSIFRRLLWLAVFLVCSTLMGIQIIERIIYFYSYPVTVNVHVNFNRTLAFPAITLCNQNAFRATAATDRKLYRLLEDIYSRNGSLEDTDDFLASHNMTDMRLEDMYLWTSHQKEDLIVACEWQDEKCGPDNFTQILTDHGVCFNFNNDYLNTLRVSSTGKLHLEGGRSPPQVSYTEEGVSPLQGSYIQDLLPRSSTLRISFTSKLILRVSSTGKLILRVSSTGKLILRVSSTGKLILRVSSIGMLILRVSSTGKLILRVFSTAKLISRVSSTGKLILRVFSTAKLILSVSSTGKLHCEVSSAGKLHSGSSPKVIYPQDLLHKKLILRVSSTGKLILRVSSTGKLILRVSSTGQLYHGVYSTGKLHSGTSPNVIYTQDLLHKHSLVFGSESPVDSKPLWKLFQFLVLSWCGQPSSNLQRHRLSSDGPVLDLTV